MKTPPLRIMAARKRGKLARLTATGNPCTERDLPDTLEALALNASNAIIAIRGERSYTATPQEPPDCLKRTPARIMEYKPPHALIRLIYEAGDAEAARALARAVLRRLMPREILEIDPGSSKPGRLRPTPPALKALSKAEGRTATLLKGRPALAVTDPDILLVEALQTAWEAIEQAKPSLTARIAGATNTTPVTAKTREKLNILLYHLYLKEAVIALTLRARRMRPPPRELAHYTTIELELDDATILTVTPLPPGTMNTAGYINTIINVLGEVTLQAEAKTAILPLYPITQKETLNAISRTLAVNKDKLQKIKIFIY